MHTVIHRAEERGVAEHGWLHSRFSFSFADWYNPERMGFGALRVINDDSIDPASGFGMHAHKDMEIITIVMEGAVTHQDSMGNRGTVEAGEVQVMSAGTGVVHAELNESGDTALKLFQLWIVPDRAGHAPRYAQSPIMRSPVGDTVLVGPIGTNAPLHIHQDAWITHYGIAPKGAERVTLKHPDHGAYVLVVSGSAKFGDVTLGTRDAVGVRGVSSFDLASQEGATLLVIEVPH
ncbi:MAG: pirin family protein [Candidatus Pacebacteria bacterium]|nr:pirin family protein [Candidatus Paceibacterota bacterium]